MVSKNHMGSDGSRLWFKHYRGQKWTVQGNLSLLRSGLRLEVKSTIWLRSGLRFQVKSTVRLRSGLNSTTALLADCDISHAFNFIGM